MDMNIAIIGGGLSGFAIGIGLLQLGLTRVTVYERDLCMESRRQGYGLTILQGITALKHLGVLEDVKKMDTPSRSHFLFKNDGTMIGFFGTLFWPSVPSHATKTNKKYNLHIGRQALRNILMKRYINLHPLGMDGIKWGKRSKSLNTVNSKILFEDGSESDPIDLIVGCDGINSTVRKWKYPVDVPLNYLGIIVVLGITRADGHFLGCNRVFQSMDGCTRLFVMPYSSNSNTTDEVMWQLSFPLCEDDAQRLSKNSRQLKNHVIERCGQWHCPIPMLIESTSYENLMGIPAYDRDIDKVADESPNTPAIALLGDAQHPMSPFKGQGANQALLDAVSLTDKISKSLGTHLGSTSPVSSRLEEIVKAYEVEMMSRVASKVRESRERVSSFHSPDVLDSQSYLHRGVDLSLLDLLNANNINANYKNTEKPIEDAIVEFMRK